MEELLWPRLRELFTRCKTIAPKLYSAIKKCYSELLKEPKFEKRDRPGREADREHDRFEKLEHHGR